MITPKPVLKFAATRTLATLALTHPESVSKCNLDLETLIADPNRSIATYAITTLLKVLSRFIQVEPNGLIELIDWKRSFCRPSHQADHWILE